MTALALSSSPRRRWRLPGTATGWLTGWFLVVWIGVVVLPLLIISAFGVVTLTFAHRLLT